MTDREKKLLFIELITEHQSRLYGYIFAMVHSREDADDLFQATSMVIWRKFDAYQLGTSFISWAFQIARFEVRNHFRSKSLPQVHFGKELLESLAESDLDETVDETQSYRDALTACLKQVSSADQSFLDLFYGEELSAQQIGEKVGRKRQSVSNSLRRIRKSLFDCIMRKVARETQK